MLIGAAIAIVVIMPLGGFFVAGPAGALVGAEVGAEWGANLGGMAGAAYGA